MASELSDAELDVIRRSAHIGLFGPPQIFVDSPPSAEAELSADVMVAKLIADASAALDEITDHHPKVLTYSAEATLIALRELLLILLSGDTGMFEDLGSASGERERLFLRAYDFLLPDREQSEPSPILSEEEIDQLMSALDDDGGDGTTGILSQDEMDELLKGVEEESDGEGDSAEWDSLAYAFANRFITRGIEDDDRLISPNALAALLFANLVTDNANLHEALDRTLRIDLDALFERFLRLLPLLADIFDHCQDNNRAAFTMSLKLLAQPLEEN